MNPLKMLSRGGAVSEPSDADFENVTLLLHGDGTNGAQNNTFLDSSTNNFTITRNGNTTQGTFSPFSKVDGRWGNYLVTTSDRLTTSSSNAAFSFGTGDFTVEGFVNLNAIADCMIFQMSTASTGYNGSTSNTVAAYIGGTNKFEIYAANTSTASTNAVVTSSDIGQWRHFAIVRSSGTTKVYWNGSEVAGLTSISDTTNYSMTYCVIGTVFNNTYALKGYLSNFRVLKGTALYSGSTITVPTGPLTAITNTDFLISQSNRFVDNSSNAIGLTVSGSPKVTPFSPFAPTAAYDASVNGGSGYWDGTGDYLMTPSNSAFEFGTGDWTIEFFAYFSTVAGASGHILYDGRPTVVSPTIYITSSVLYYYTNGQNRITGPTLVTNQWYHIVVTRNSGSTRLFVNGVQQGSTYSDSNNYSSSAVGIGVDTNAVNPNNFHGYFSSFRVLKGTGYSSISVPTAPLTAITNTSLLLNFTNAGIIDNTMSNNLETVGNAQIDTTTKKYGTGSMEFDGSGDFLLAPTSENFGYGLGDFTVECWVYKQANPSADAGIIEQRPASTDGNYLTIGLNSSGRLFVYVNSSARISASASTALSAQAWDHVAYVRSGGNSGVLYINGTSVGSWSDTTNYVASTPLRVGQHAYNAAQFNGYIDDLRITNGKARYTSNFTPPTAAFEDIGT